MQIKIKSGKLVGKGVAYARKVGGTSHATTQTWTLPDTPIVQRMLNALGAYGWQHVQPRAAGTVCANPLDNPSIDSIPPLIYLSRQILGYSDIQGGGNVSRDDQGG